MLALKQFRTKAAGLPDLLNYAALIDDGIVLNKDGSLMGGFFYRGDDAAVATESERNYITALVNNQLSRFGTGWAIWCDAIRLPSPGYPAPERSHFPEPITAMIDAERREMFEKSSGHYETEYGIVIQYLPPMRRESRIDDLIYDDDGRNDSEPGSRHLAEFKKRLADLESSLGDLLHMRRMGTRQVAEPDTGQYESDELVNYLHFCLTGEGVALRIPDCPMYLDAWLGFPQLWPGDTPKLGEEFISCVAVEGFPGRTVPGMLDILDSLPIHYRWSSRFIAMDEHEAVAALKRYRSKWQQKVRGFWSQVIKSNKGPIDQDAVDMVADADAALTEARSGLVAYGYYTPVVVLMHSDRSYLEELARYVKTEVERKGFSARVESVNTMEAWLGSLPGHTYPNVRRPLMHSLNLADLMPLSSHWPGLHSNPCAFYPDNSPPLMQAITTGQTPFRLNLHVGDLGHSLLFGPPGAGKSTLLAMIAAQARRYRSRPESDGSTQPMTVIAFDKGRSIYPLCSATGGAHYDIGSDNSNLTLAPLADIDSDSAAAWAQGWIRNCFQLQTGNSPTTSQVAAIRSAINLMRQETPKELRSLTEFITNVQDQEVRDALAHYTISGTMGHLLDGQDDGVSFSDFTVFEIDELMKMDEEDVIPVLLYLFRRFEQTLTGQPAVLLLDEAWVVLGHPVFRDRLVTWLRELRRANCVVVLATQSLSDAVRSGLLDKLLEQCPTKVFLPNPDADDEGGSDTPGPAQFYRMFGLNHREIQLLKNAQMKREYYYKSPLGRRKFELGLGPLALSFVGVSDKQTLREIGKMEKQHGENWPLYWLEKRGVDYEKYVA